MLSNDLLIKEREQSLSPGPEKEFRHNQSHSKIYKTFDWHGLLKESHIRANQAPGTFKINTLNMGLSIIR